MGGPQPAPPTAPQGRPCTGPDALDLLPRRHQPAGQQRPCRTEARAACRGGRQLGVLAVSGERGGLSPGRQHPLRNRLRDHRPGAGGADHCQRGVRGGGHRLPADRRAQEHRLHPAAGGRRLPGPDPHPGAHRRRRRDGAGQLLGGAAAGGSRPLVDQHHGSRRAAGTDRARGAGTRTAGRAAVCRCGYRGRAGPPGRARLRGALASRQTGAAPAGQHRPGRPVTRPARSAVMLGRSRSG